MIGEIMVVYEIVLELGTWISKPKRFEMSTASNMATQFNPVHAQTSKKSITSPSQSPDTIPTEPHEGKRLVAIPRGGESLKS